MKIEFFKNQGVFTHPVMFRPLGYTEWIPIEALDDNTQRLIFELCRDNYEIGKYITFLRTRNKGITVTEMVQAIVVKFFGKLDNVWDIDERELNLEIN